MPDLPCITFVCPVCGSGPKLGYPSFEEGLTPDGCVVVDENDGRLEIPLTCVNDHALSLELVTEFLGPARILFKIH